jgi:putative transposase
MEHARKPHLEYQRDEHRVHLVVYHLIWCPRRRRPVLVGLVEARCRALIEQACAEHHCHWQNLTLAIRPDPIHLFVRAWPTDSGADVVKACKGKTSSYLRREFPSLRKLPSMWTRSYFCSTAGTVSRATSQASIDAQKGL